jgi:NAD+ kinase
MVMARFDKIAFVASDTQEAQEARVALTKRYGDASPEGADAIVALGGDGLMLQTMHAHLNSHPDLRHEPGLGRLPAQRL